MLNSVGRQHVTGVNRMMVAAAKTIVRPQCPPVTTILLLLAAFSSPDDNAAITFEIFLTVQLICRHSNCLHNRGKIFPCYALGRAFRSRDRVDSDQWPSTVFVTDRQTYAPQIPKWQRRPENTPDGTYKYLYLSNKRNWSLHWPYGVTSFCGRAHVDLLSEGSLLPGSQT